TGTYRLMAGLLYGSGLRLMECVRLRVKDVDFAHNQIMVRDGKGQKDRVTILPQRFQLPLRAHLERVKEQHENDLAQGLGAVYLWPALERKYPSAHRNGSGSMCFRLAGCQWTLVVAGCVGIISTRMPRNGL